jgi:hypothetical protein
MSLPPLLLLLLPAACPLAPALSLLLLLRSRNLGNFLTLELLPSPPPVDELDVVETEMAD